MNIYDLGSCQGIELSFRKSVTVFVADSTAPSHRGRMESGYLCVPECETFPVAQEKQCLKHSQEAEQQWNDFIMMIANIKM